ncbi:efflux transporter outer membrane subunit [Diaphorobacter sp.]|uniref:efflux transporter outer membrane subunit n=1 Tax=Diaphorobacter sp. TaxID=1934310 RepID=UPI00258FDBF0|nr:efflux transporter outer membrane subunit [Diaphorobacter sp.]
MALHPFIRHAGMLAAGLWLAGCAVQQVPADRAPPELPARWAAGFEAAGDGVTAGWWHSFGSAELAAQIEQAQARSLDVAAAAARVRQARARAGRAGAALAPALAASQDAGREGRIGGAAVGGNRFGAGLSASYEVDFWGRQQAARDGALFALQASVFDRDTVRLTVTASVANAWLQAVALCERIGIGERNLQSAQRLLALVESRVRAGAATLLELAQQRGLVASQQRELAALRQQAGEARTALGVLLARPAGVPVGCAPLASLAVPDVAAGLPAELLARRPDIARAEARLAAADASVAAARAAMLPALTLSGGIGTGGDRLRRVLDDPLYSLATGMAAPIFDGGRLAAGHELAQAQREELLADYHRAIVEAFGDVEVALNTQAGVQAQAAAQAEELEQARRALDLAESRYRAGAQTLLTLLDAQRTLYAAQDAATRLKAQRLQAAVALYRALGGGWQASGTPRPHEGRP